MMHCGNTLKQGVLSSGRSQSATSPPAFLKVYSKWFFTQAARTSDGTLQVAVPSVVSPTAGTWHR
eukprot:7536934-Lingulodinium_polyedra.AAC.1